MFSRLTKIGNIDKSIFARDVIYTVAGQGIVMLLALLMNKVISNYLRPADFAIFSIANRTASILGFLMLLGLGIAIPRYIARVRATSDAKGEATIFYTGLLLLVIAVGLISLLTIPFQHELAIVIFNDSSRVSLILPTLLFAIGIAFSSFIYAYFRAVDKFKQYNVLQIVFQSVNLILVVVSGTNLILQLSLRGFIITALSVAIAGFVAVFIYRGVTISRRKILKSGKRLLNYCLPRVPGEIFLFSYTVVPLIIINEKFGLQVTAAFATAVTLNAIVTPLFQFVGMVLLPYVSKGLVNGELEDIRRKIEKLRHLYLMIGVLSVLFIWAFAEIIISLLFSREYAHFAPIVKVVYVSVIPYSLYLLLRNPLDAISKVPFNTINLGISFMVLVAIVWLAPNAYLSAAAFPLSYMLLGMLSEFSWHRKFHNTGQKAREVFSDII